LFWSKLIYKKASEKRGEGEGGEGGEKRGEGGRGRGELNRRGKGGCFPLIKLDIHIERNDTASHDHAIPLSPS
jgi:hypothetical protein